MTTHLSSLANLSKNFERPAMFVDLNHLEFNIHSVLNALKDSSQKIRIASKSVRSPEILKLISEKLGERFNGIMCFSVREAALLFEWGFRDLLLAYPLGQVSEIKEAIELIQKGATLTLMVDSAPHLELIASTIQKEATQTPVRLCVDLDLSLRLLGGLLHFGVERSPIRSLLDFKSLFALISKNPKLALVGVMGYEAQIAGVQEKSPFSKLLNPIKTLIKKWSIPKIQKRRREVFEFLKSEHIELDFFNGGGTGSLISTKKEPWVSEITVGSGFLQSHLFDYYSESRHPSDPSYRKPALFFALPVTRLPENGIVTCQSGGFIASGEPGWDKSPVIVYPEGAKPLSFEGFGEVQTPVRLSGGTLSLGESVLCRPAKAGEIAERFNDYHLISGGSFLKTVKTYRGLGHVFY